MTLQDYVRIIKRRGWIIVLLMLLTAISAFAFSKLQTPIYKSSVEILVQPARADFGLTQSAKWLLRSYVSWINTDTQAQEVIDLLSLDREPGDLRSDVTVATDESRFVIQINVEDPDGDLANDIAQTWTDLFIQWRNAENDDQNKEDRVKATQLDPPRYGLARPKWKINTLAGAIFGALLGGVIVFILEWIESGVVRRPEDVDRYLSLPMLGAIPTVKIDTSRPYLIGGRESDDRVKALAPPLSGPAFSAPVSSPSSRPPQKESPEQSGPTNDILPLPAEDAGPIEPTILLSKGDE
ncbi:MAG: hypothetical protein JXA42_17995 [Anaerolineales bacterium]|nr:hypothetical protein [Anaerolineales bacterium]